MPGKGCQLRKALRRAERAQEAADEANSQIFGESPAKVAKKFDPQEYASLQAAREAGALNKPERVWAEVPQLKDLSFEDRQKAMKLCQAMVEAVQDSKTPQLTISNLGAHFKVQKLKKDPLFHNQRLLDLVQRHLDIFELVPDGATANGWAIKLKEGVSINTKTPEDEQLEASLPKRIEEPSGMEEMVQAFRIECIIALHKRGYKVQLNEIGQDLQVVKARAAIGGANHKLLDLIRAFPTNFTTEDLGSGNYNVELVSTDVSDTSGLQAVALQGGAKYESTPGSAREGFINQVKEFQKQGMENKVKWHQFITSKGSSTFDPARHTDEVLEEFLAAAETGLLPDPDPETMAEAAKRDSEMQAMREAKGKGKFGKGAMAMMFGGKGKGKPFSMMGGDSWGWDDWSGMQEAMAAFMMMMGKGDKGGKNFMKGGKGDFGWSMKGAAGKSKGKSKW